LSSSTNGGFWLFYGDVTKVWFKTFTAGKNQMNSAVSILAGPFGHNMQSIFMNFDP